MKFETFKLEAAPLGVQELFDACGRAETSWGWFETLARTTLLPVQEGQVAVLFDDSGNAVSAIPLAQANGVVARGLTAPYTTLFQPPLGQVQHAAALGQFLGRSNYDVIRLDCMDKADEFVSALMSGLSRAGLLLCEFQHFVNWFEVVPEFGTYWEKRSGAFKTIVRKSLRLESQGRMRFECYSTGGDWQLATNVYEHIYARSWKAAEPYPDFAGTLLQRLGPSGMVKLGVLTIDDEPAATQIWMVNAPRATIFKVAHDAKFDRYSPGTALTYWLLKKFCNEEGVHEIDFGRGNDAYKKKWLSCRRFRSGIVAANPRSIAGMRSVLLEVAPTKISALLRPGLEDLRLARPERRMTHYDTFGPAVEILQDFGAKATICLSLIDNPSGHSCSRLQNWQTS